MAAIASTATGDFSVGGTWVGGVAPAEGDTCTIESGHVVTIDATITVGDDTATPAIDILNGGELDWDNAGDDILTLKGNLAIRNGSTLTLDGTANGANQLTIKQNYSAALAVRKYYIQPYAGCTFNLDGANKTRQWDTITTGDATTNIIDTTNNNDTGGWLVGDVVGVNDTERTITGIAGTQITLSGNVTFVTGDYIVNRTCNIKITVHNTAFGTSILPSGAITATMDWIEIERSATSTGVFWADNSGNTVTMNNCVIAGLQNNYGLRVAGTVIVNESLFYKCQSYPMVVNRNTYLTFTDNFDYYSSASVYTLIAFGAFRFLSATITGNVTKGTGNAGVNGGGGSTVIYSNNTHLGMDLKLTNIANLTGTNNAVSGVATALTVNNVYAGEMSNSTITGGVTDVIVTGIMNLRLNNCTFQAPPVISYSSFTGGALYTYTVNGDVTTHKTYKPYGTYEKQSGVKFSGSYAALMNPTDASNPLTATSTVFATDGETVAYSAYMRKSVAMAVLPFIQLSGAGITTSIATMVDTQDDWQLLSVSGLAAQDGFAKLELVCQNAVGNVYIDDDQDSYRFWFEGDVPSVVPKPSLTANDIMNTVIQDSTFSQGTFGQTMRKFRSTLGRL